MAARYLGSQRKFVSFVIQKAVANAGAASDIHKENYKEALNSHKFYGNLRTQISWPPATILGAGLALSSKAISSASKFDKWVIVACYVAILLIIWAMVYYLQLSQAKYMAVAKDAQEKWVDAAKGIPVEAKTFAQLSADLPTDKRKLVPDLSTCAFGFFAAVLGLFVYFAIFNTPSIEPSNRLLISIIVKGQPTVTPHPTIPVLGVRIDCGSDDNPIQIGPFKPAKFTDFDSRFPLHTAKEAAARIGELITKTKGQRFVVLILIGSADKQRLKQGPLQIFGSNRGLAQARAQTAKAQLLPELAARGVPNPEAVIALDAGPIRIGSRVNADELASDREVRVCVVSQPEASRQVTQERN